MLPDSEEKRTSGCGGTKYRQFPSDIWKSQLVSVRYSDSSISFSSQGLVKLLEKKAFKIDLIRHYKFEYNPFGWLQTMLNSSGIQENLLYDLLKSSELKKNNQKPIPFFDYFKLFFLCLLYLPLSFLLSIIEALLQKGGTIEVYSIKK